MASPTSYINNIEQISIFITYLHSYNPLYVGPEKNSFLPNIRQEIIKFISKRQLNLCVQDILCESDSIGVFLIG
jgi:hypothetical protein